MPRSIMDNGVVREMTTQEEAAFEAALPTLSARRAACLRRLAQRRW
ncbi:MAG: hypothetical protein IT546_14345, partial [Caulobacteraceae bacterium]|nr:hypothetical protein [Caulobacteraceae bacterium]